MPGNPLKRTLRKMSLSISDRQGRTQGNHENYFTSMSIVLFHMQYSNLSYTCEVGFIPNHFDPVFPQSPRIYRRNIEGLHKKRIEAYGVTKIEHYFYS